MNGRKLLLVICDGMGDRPSRDFGNRTPLEAAKTPNLDRMAAEGSLGLMDPIAPGVRPGSDVATMNLLGYDPYRFYQGRGGLEALGAGLDISPGDVAFRCNFATVDDDLKVVDRRAGRIQDGTRQLAEAVGKIRLLNVKVTFRETVSHRGVLVLSGPGLSRHVSDVDPHVVGSHIHQSKPLQATSAAKRTASLLNRFVKKSYETLCAHPVNRDRRSRGLLPANIVLPRGAGSVPKVRGIREQHAVTGVTVGSVALIRGVSRMAGLGLVDVPGATGGLTTNFEGKANAALSSLNDVDFAVLHFKGADVAGHDGDFRGKAAYMEKVDAQIGRLRNQVLERIQLQIGSITNRSPSGIYLIVTADHSTPVEVRDHSSDPVPVLIWGPSVLPNGRPGFSEKNAAHGNLSRIRGADLMPIIVDLLGKSEKFGF